MKDGTVFIRLFRCGRKQIRLSRRSLRFFRVFYVRVAGAKDTCDQHHTLKQTRNNHSTGNRSHQHVFAGRICEESENQGDQVHAGEQDCAEQCENTFCFFHNKFLLKGAGLEVLFYILSENAGKRKFMWAYVLVVRKKELCYTYVLSF